MLSNMQVVMRLIMAAILGGLVGFERETHNKRLAGFRTHILVCLGSALVMLTSLYMFFSYGSITPVDPGRIAASVITGIGFLGAGTIIRSKVSVTGLTTAASLWAVAGVGLAVGCGFMMAGITATIIMLATLYILRKIPISEKDEKGGENG